MAGTATVLIEGEIDPVKPGCVTAAGVRATLLAQYPFTDITVDINSPGGEYYEGFDIYDTLRGFGVPVKTRVPEGCICASIATVVLLAGDTREVAPGEKRGMIHNPWSQPAGDYYQLIEYAEKELKPVMESLIAFYAKRVRLDKSTLDTLMRVDTDLSGEQMVTMGFATSLINSAVAAPLAFARRKIIACASIRPRTNQSTNTQSIMSNLITGLFAAIKVIKASTLDAPVKNLDLTLGDGSTLTTNSSGDMPVMGDTVVVTATGIAPEDGQYPITMGDGTTCTITVVGGMIESVIPDDQALEADPLDSTENTELTALQAENAQLKERLSAIESNFNTFQARSSVVMDQMTKALGLKESPELPSTSAPRAMAAPSAKPVASAEDIARQAMLDERKAMGQKKAA